MRFFSSKKKHKSNKICSATIITSCSEVTGDIKVNDTIHVDGKVVGDIDVQNTIVIGRAGIVIGNVKAKNAIINGVLKGSITCDTLEIMKTGKLSDSAHVKHLVLDGIIEGEIIGIESIKILSNGKLRIKDTTELLKIVDQKMNLSQSSKKD